ncbi:tRNA (adenosine(37)-N6)-dimethylallyltransferase MiaA [Winogradskyella maritima]|uniref:tRNA dimethylallyltransferase n=1 Tax=Winogradskyella maritima TaxID=1517766 RepID=A0ABV8ACG8_9FLAO|nr:tRNA (adenosine(37)-N6)-dimethylallyltransferase MiaA [Winogradskyella maritima]
MTKFLLSVVGPTAIGKTALSIQLAKHFETEIISSDSRQFFKEMSIGTAVPSREELSQVKHHFIQHLSIQDPYSVGQFEKDAIARLDTIFRNHDVAVMVGGSGLYSNAVIHGLDDFPDVDSDIRTTLNKRIQDEGISVLQNELKEKDPKAYDTIAIDNPQRLIRALEICIGTGRPYSSFLAKGKITRPFETISVGLTAERSIIYERINQRVDIMMDSGLLEEAKRLYPHKDLNALNTVGYKELFKYFDDEWELDLAVSEIKKNTRRFAKRQLTWYRKYDSILWFDFETPLDQILDTLTKHIETKKSS